MVQVVRLDDILSSLCGTNFFLKIDTQGFEQEVLAGSSGSLPKMLGIQLELPIVHLYDGTWSLSEAFAFMSANGFVLSQVRPVNYSPQDPASLVEIDAIFRRYDDGIDR